MKAGLAKLFSLRSALPNRSVLVFLEIGRSLVDAQLVAIKTIKKIVPDYKQKIELLREEAVLLSTLDHLHIIRLLEDDREGSVDYFVTEYCLGGDLRGAIVGHCCSHIDGS